MGTSAFTPLMPAPPFPPLAFAFWVVFAAADMCRVNGSRVFAAADKCGAIQASGSEGGQCLPNGVLLLAACSQFASICIAVRGSSCQVSGGAQAHVPLGESGNRAFVPGTDLIGPAVLHHMAAIAAIAAHTYVRLDQYLLLEPQQTGLKERTDATVPVLKMNARLRQYNMHVGLQ